jgi:hypothetical protein
MFPLAACTLFLSLFLSLSFSLSLFLSPSLYISLSLSLCSQIIEANGAPCVIHCAAGKDRTGVAMAFILLACGVGVKEVLDDYELSNVHNAFRCAQVRRLCYFLFEVFTE